MDDESFSPELFKQLKADTQVARSKWQKAEEAFNVARQEAINAKGAMQELETRLYEEFGRWIDQP